MSRTYGLQVLKAHELAIVSTGTSQKLSPSIEVSVKRIVVNTFSAKEPSLEPVWDGSLEFSTDKTSTNLKLTVKYDKQNLYSKKWVPQKAQHGVDAAIKRLAPFLATRRIIGTVSKTIDELLAEGKNNKEGNIVLELLKEGVKAGYITIRFFSVDPPTSDPPPSNSPPSNPPPSNSPPSNPPPSNPPLSDSPLPDTPPSNTPPPGPPPSNVPPSNTPVPDPPAIPSPAKPNKPDASATVIPEELEPEFVPPTHPNSPSTMMQIAGYRNKEVDISQTERLVKQILARAAEEPAATA